MRYAVSFFSDPGEVAARWEGEAASHSEALDRARAEVPADVADFRATTYTPEDVASRQEWRIVGGDQMLFGDRLARRLVDRGLRLELDATHQELAACGVGACVNTGVSSWERVR